MVLLLLLLLILVHGSPPLELFTLLPGVRDGANHGVHQHPEPAVRRGGGGALRGQVHPCLVVQGTC